MPSRDEILQMLVDKTTALDARVSALENAAAADPWQEEFQYPGGHSNIADEIGAAIGKDLGGHTPAPLAPASGERHPDDPEEDTPAVLEARARIEQANREDLQPVLHEPPLKINIGLEHAEVVVPVATKQQEFMRKGNAKRAIANLPGLDHTVATDAYIKGGPVWLHAFNREHVVGLPPDLRQQMVNDVALSMPEHAHEFAADVLKVTDFEAEGSWNYDAADAVLDEAIRRGA